MQLHNNIQDTLCERRSEDRKRVNRKSMGCGAMVDRPCGRRLQEEEARQLMLASDHPRPIDPTLLLLAARALFYGSCAAWFESRIRFERH
eukprot:1126223-Rhodomonas_salina.4